MKRKVFILSMMILLSGCASAPYRQARKINTIEAYENFIKEYPDSPDTLKACKKIEKIYFNQAINENTLESYYDYLKKFPQGAYMNRACEGFINAFQQVIYENNNKTFPTGKLASAYQILVDTAPIIQSSKNGSILLLSLYEILSLEYIKTGMYRSVL